MSCREPSPTPADKLRFFKSPVVCAGDDAEGPILGYSPDEQDSDIKDHGRSRRNFPEFARHKEPTLLEVFFDLLFAANYNIFSDNQEVTNLARFKAYIGFFYLLWQTWLLVTLFDARYLTDCIFARMTRAVHLGVLVGFTVVAPKFDPENQEIETMQAMSLILMISRACLALEYTVTLWHVRKFKKAREPLHVQVAVHLIAAIIYLILASVFRMGKGGQLHTIWYYISGVEGILAILLSNLSPVLGLTKTHIIRRLTILTVIIIGDGIIQLAREVVMIVKHPNAWNWVTIGLVTAATATVYFIFLVYFDWLRSAYYLPALRQQLWISLHLPFHLSLILLAHGFTQILIWSKIVNEFNTLSVGLSRNSYWLVNATTDQVQRRINNTAQLFFQNFPPKVAGTWEAVNGAIANITEIPNGFWTDLALYYITDDAESFANEDKRAKAVFVNAIQTIMLSMANALFTAFGIDVEEDVMEESTNGHKDMGIAGGFQGQVQSKTWDRYRLVFCYTYVAAGFTLFFMIILSVVARTTPFKTWPVVRLVIIFFLALGTGLTAILFFEPSAVFHMLVTPWVLPIITFVWTVVLIITHVNGDGIRRHTLRLRRRWWPQASAPRPGLAHHGD